MKKILYLLLIALLASCGSGVSPEQIIGKWKLVAVDENPESPLAKNFTISLFAIAITLEYS